MSKPIYRTRMTLKSGRYAVREFSKPSTAIAHARQLHNEGASGYVEKQWFVAGMQRTEPILILEPIEETA